MAASHIICGLWSLVPCRGSDPEETALTASDAVRVSRSRDPGALVQVRVKPVPRGGVCRWSKDGIRERGELGQAVSRAVGEGALKDSRRSLPQFRPRQQKCSRLDGLNNKRRSPLLEPEKFKSVRLAWRVLRRLSAQRSSHWRSVPVETVISAWACGGTHFAARRHLFGAWIT